MPDIVMIAVGNENPEWLKRLDFAKTFDFLNSHIIILPLSSAQFPRLKEPHPRAKGKRRVGDGVRGR